jgi:hypothetical protein
MPTSMLSRASGLVYDRSLGSSPALLLAKALQHPEMHPHLPPPPSFGIAQSVERRRRQSARASPQRPSSRQARPRARARLHDIAILCTKTSGAKRGRRNRTLSHAEEIHFRLGRLSSVCGPTSESDGTGSVSHFIPIPAGRHDDLAGCSPGS